MFRSRAVPLWLALLLIAAVAGGSAALIGYFAWSRTGQAARLAKLESANRALQARSEQLAREVDALRLGLPVPPPPHEAEARRPRTAPGGAEVLEEAKTLEQVRTNLAAANASIASLESRIRELETALENTSAENRRLAASESDLKEKFASTGRVLEAVQSELKTRTDRLTQLEITNDLLNRQNRTIAEKVARVTQAMPNLEEINRRRETYLTTILRRYRDITEQYRALSARLENPRDNASAAGPELSRIQSGIMSAEDDLRQIASLNAQALRLQQKLTAK